MSFGSKHTSWARVAVVALAVALSGLLSRVAIAATQGPEVQAWWTVANWGDPVPAPPAAGVDEGNLLVEGSDAAARVGDGAPPTAVAVAGLTFAVRPGDAVRELALPIVGTPPAVLSVVACQATQPFTSESNGEWSHVPAYDESKCLPTTVRETEIVVANLGALVQGEQLSVVLLPGRFDRVVLHAPVLKVVTVDQPELPATTEPPLFVPPPTSVTGEGQAVPPPLESFAPNVAMPDSSGPTQDLPDVAADAGTDDASSVNANPTAGTTELINPARRAAALAVVALEVLGFLLFMRGRRRATATGAEGGPSGAATSLGGIGTFRRERQGFAPRL